MTAEHVGQAALLANVLTSTGSWPNLLPPDTTTPWPVRTSWFCGIAFALASVLTAADQTIRLHRMAGHRDGLVLIRQSLRARDRVLIGAEWKYRPRRMQVYAWQLGVLFLAGSVVFMMAGLIFLIWSAVVEDLGRGRGFDDNGKVRTLAPFRRKHSTDFRTGCRGVHRCGPQRGHRVRRGAGNSLSPGAERGW
ncbi:hypothetical protein CTA1_5431 [Colletotrichum tanaceti]|uniref:Uncharacterized protein n=1 Tax=Colletotrichum tanaceti TaxID=1306861 RepID=A0A4U6XGA6_9PEZI|nr:hypothetical protein CTA1_5431 [Colletotrichum tanaceti]